MRCALCCDLCVTGGPRNLGVSGRKGEGGCFCVLVVLVACSMYRLTQLSPATIASQPLDTRYTDSHPSSRAQLSIGGAAPRSSSTSTTALPLSSTTVLCILTILCRTPPYYPPYLASLDRGRGAAAPVLATSERGSERRHWVATPPPGRRGRRFTKGSRIGGGYHPHRRPAQRENLRFLGSRCAIS